MKHTRIIVWILVLIGAIAAAPEGAFAQTPPVESEKASSDRAYAIFRRGNTLAKKDRWSEAEPLFREAWGIKRSYDIGGNLGVAEAHLGKWRDAAEHLTFALETFPANGKPEHRKLLEDKLDLARKQVAAVTIKVDVEGAVVSVDGVDIDPLLRRGAVFVEPGAHRVDAKLAGYSPAHREIQAIAGASVEVVLTLVLAPAALPLPSKVRLAPIEPVEATRGPGIGWIAASGAAAAVGLGVGVALTVAANGKSAEADELGRGLGASTCAGAAATPQCASLRSTLTAQGQMANGAIASFVVGGALSAVTAGLGVWRASSGKAAKKLAPTVTATVGTRDIGLIFAREVVTCLVQEGVLAIWECWP